MSIALLFIGAAMLSSEYELIGTIMIILSSIRMSNAIVNHER
jgi:hypothetical protein